MLTTLLPMLEALGIEGGAATSLGRSGGIGSTLGKLLGGSSVQAFGSQNELGGAMRQISDLTANLAAAKEAMTSMRGEHEQLGNKAREDERLYGFRDPAEHQRMADLQRQQIEHARAVQQQQQQLQDLQSRAAVTMDPSLAAQQARGNMFRRAGGLAIAGQAVQAFGPSVLKNLPGVQAGAELFRFGAGPANANVAGSMANAATGAISNIAGGAAQGAAAGSFAGPIGTGVGAALGGLAAASKELAMLPNRIVSWSESLLESQKTLSRFSGVMAQADAQRDVRGLKRDIASADITGGSTADLSNNLQNLYDAIRPLKDAVTNVLARDLSVLVRVLAECVPLMNQLVKVGSKLADPMDFMGIRKAMKEVEEAGRRRDAGMKSGIQLLEKTIRNFKGDDPLIPRSVPRR